MTLGKRKPFSYNRLMKIVSVDNPKVKEWERLRQKKYRDEAGLFIVEEKHMIQEAMSAGCLDTLLIRENLINPFKHEAVEVSEKVMKKLSVNRSANDYIAICRKPVIKVSKEEAFIVLEEVQDPGNMGTIIRTAYSFGYDAVYISNNSCDVFNEKTLQSSQGSIFHLPVIRMPITEIYAWLKEKGVYIYGTSLQTDKSIETVERKTPFALVMGNEGRGLSEFAQKKADYLFKIPMANFDSLNVSIAMGICAYEFKKVF